MIVALALALAQAAPAAPPPSPLPPRAPGEQTLVTEFQVVPNVVYATAEGDDLRLDVYKPRAAGRYPTAVMYHGGGWVRGSKEAAVLGVVPWLESGFAVVNVQYRLGRQGRAPAAVEDALCALRWTFANAETHGFDPARIVTTGDSAGGHLALAAALIPASSGLARGCPFSGPGPASWSSPPPPWDPLVAAVVNWYGITDVVSLLDGPGARFYAIEWLGARDDRDEVARQVSPLTWVRPGAPPVLTVHGDADTGVPYTHAVRLHDALTRAGVPNRLVTIPGGGHGGFDRAQLATIAAETRAFLDRVLPRR